MIGTGGPTGNLVEGNLIGTRLDGLGALPNAAGGVLISSGASGNTIGGVAPGTKNVISGNLAGPNSHGVTIDKASGNTVEGNYIGTTITGMAPLRNGGDGVFVTDGGAAPANGNTIGGTTVSARNVISGNSGNGVRIAGALANSNTVAGNFIGTDAGGSIGGVSNMANGVLVTTSAGSNTIGGTTAVTPGGCTGSCNLIAGNGAAGVRIDSATSVRNAILSNSITNNLALGIDLDLPPGVTPNDPGDGDAGANDLQNFPIITSAAYDGVNTNINGSINSTAGTNFTIQVFANGAPDPSGNGEGLTFIGSTTSLTNGAGNGGWVMSVPGNYTLLSATATNPAVGTSEFSPTYANPKEALNLLADKGTGTAVDVTFTPACGASDHAAYLGTTPIAGGLAWATSFCGLGISGSATFDPGTPAPGSSFYFAIVGNHATREGSYGRDSSSVERPEAVGVGACDRAQELTVTCP